MALTTATTPETIAVALGQPVPDSGSTRDLQWVMWIGDALRLVQRRVTSMEADESDIDADDLDYVIREAVVSQARKPDDATQVSVSTDDTSVTKSFRASTGQVAIRADWWALLGLATSRGKAFSVDLMPPGAGIGGDRATYWWAP